MSFAKPLFSLSHNLVCEEDGAPAYASIPKQVLEIEPSSGWEATFELKSSYQGHLPHEHAGSGPDSDENDSDLDEKVEQFVNSQAALRDVFEFPLTIQSKIDDGPPLPIPSKAIASSHLLMHSVKSVQRELLLPFTSETIARVLDGICSRVVALSSIDEALMTLELSLHLSVERVAHACVKYLVEVQSDILTPHRVIAFWSSLLLMVQFRREGVDREAPEGYYRPPPLSEGLVKELEGLCGRCKSFVVECFDAVASEVHPPIAALPPSTLDDLLGSPHLKSSSEALVLRFLWLWYRSAKGDPQRRAQFYDMVRRHIRLEVMAPDTLVELSRQHPSLMDAVGAAFVAKGRILDVLLRAPDAGAIEEARESIPYRPAMELPVTVAVSIRGVAQIYGCEEAGCPSVIMPWAFAVPGVPGVWYLSVYPRGKNEETADKYISFYLYSLNFVGEADAIVQLEVPAWRARTIKVLRVTGGSGQGSSRALSIPSWALDPERWEGADDTLNFKITFLKFVNNSYLPSVSFLGRRQCQQAFPGVELPSDPEAYVRSQANSFNGQQPVTRGTSTVYHSNSFIGLLAEHHLHDTERGDADVGPNPDWKAPYPSGEAAQTLPDIYGGQAEVAARALGVASTNSAAGQGILRTSNGGNSLNLQRALSGPAAPGTPLPWPSPGKAGSGYSGEHRPSDGGQSVGQRPSGTGQRGSANGLPSPSSVATQSYVRNPLRSGPGPDAFPWRPQPVNLEALAAAVAAASTSDARGAQPPSSDPTPLATVSEAASGKKLAPVRQGESEFDFCFPKDVGAPGTQ